MTHVQKDITGSCMFWTVFILLFVLTGVLCCAALCCMGLHNKKHYCPRCRHLIHTWSAFEHGSEHEEEDKAVSATKHQEQITWVELIYDDCSVGRFNELLNISL